MESNDKIRYFFEADAFDEKTGELRLPKHTSLNKIGHALHYLEPSFKKVTFSEKMKAVARDLQFQDPNVVQGMYIFKNPRIGGVGMASLISVQFLLVFFSQIRCVIGILAFYPSHDKCPRHKYSYTKFPLQIVPVLDF